MVAPRKPVAGSLLNMEQPAQPDFNGLLGEIYGANRALARHKDTFNLTTKSAVPGDRRQLEYYPPWEDRNPTPGKATLELYNTGESPEITKNLITGDMLHYLGSVDPRTSQEVDPTFMALKKQFMTTLTPEQIAVDRRAYEHEKSMYETPPSFDDWMAINRGDAYLRGFLTPDANDEWRKQGVYTPAQTEILKSIQQYMQRGSIAPGMNR